MKIIGNIILIVFGVICIYYSYIVSTVGNLNLGVVLPGFIGVCLILFVCLNGKIAPYTNRGIGKFIKRVVQAGLVFVSVTFCICLIFMNRASAHIPAAGKDAVIVLGAGLRGDRLSGTLTLRLSKAVEYAKENPGTVVVVSGGQGPGETITEALAMKRYLLRCGINEDNIIMEDKSKNTRQNFAFSKALLDVHFQDTPYEVVYVTNGFHILRAGFYAKKAGLSAEGLACGTLYYMLPAFYTREYLAIMWYFAYENWH